MTAREMQRKVEERILSLDIPARKFKSQDVFDWLNWGQDAFIGNRLDRSRYNNADSYEVIQKEVDDLRLISLTSSPITGSIADSSKTYDLPSGYRHLIRSTVETNKSTCDAVYRRIRIYSNDIIDEILEERLYSTTLKSPVGTLIGNKLIIYFDSKFSLGNAKITYVKTPSLISVTNNSGTLVEANCEIAEHAHNDIVELAVQYAYRILNISQPQTT